MVHVFKRVSISDEEAEIRFFRVYGTPPTHLKVKFFGGGKTFVCKYTCGLKEELQMRLGGFLISPCES
mgnify:FL=1